MWIVFDQVSSTYHKHPRNPQNFSHLFTTCLFASQSSFLFPYALVLHQTIGELEMSSYKGCRQSGSVTIDSNLAEVQQTLEAWLCRAWHINSVAAGSQSIEKLRCQIATFFFICFSLNDFCLAHVCVCSFCDSMFAIIFHKRLSKKRLPDRTLKRVPYFFVEVVRRDWTWSKALVLCTGFNSVEMWNKLPLCPILDRFYTIPFFLITLVL